MLIRLAARLAGLAVVAVAAGAAIQVTGLVGPALGVAVFGGLAVLVFTS